jgi:hypothetical protein
LDVGYKLCIFYKDKMSAFKDQSAGNRARQGHASRVIRHIVGWLFALAVLAGLGWLGFIYAGRALCHAAIDQIGDLTNTRIETKSVDFRTDGSVIIEALAIRPSKKQNPTDTILWARHVNARFALSSLLKLRPRLRELDVNDFVFNAQHDLEANLWNLSALRIGLPKGRSETLPVIRLRQGTLQYAKLSGGLVRIAATAPISAQFQLDAETPQGYAFEITTAAMTSGHAQSKLTGFWSPPRQGTPAEKTGDGAKPGIITLTGGVSSADVPALEMAWAADALAAEIKYDHDNNYEAGLRIKGLHSRLSPPGETSFVAAPAVGEKSNGFAFLQRFFNRYHPNGLVDLSLEATGNLGRLGQSTLNGRVDCRDVAFCYYNFRYPVEHVTGSLDFTQNSVILNNLKGKHKDVELAFNGWTRDFGVDWKYDIRVTSASMPLDEDLYIALSDSQKRFWAAVGGSRLGGNVAVDYHVVRQSATSKDKILDLELQGVQAEYDGFRYPLENLTGKLRLARGCAEFSNIVSQMNSRRIAINGKLAGLGTDRHSYQIVIDVNDIPLDSTLQACLPQTQRNLFDQYKPTGVADGTINVTKSELTEATFEADLYFKNASVEWLGQSRPLAISDAWARAVFTPELIDVKSLTGKYKDSSIWLTGQIMPNGPADGDGQKAYHLSATMEQVEPANELLDLLGDQARKMIEEMQLKGRVNLMVTLDKSAGGKPADYELTVDCRGNSVVLPQFPYPLKDISGTVEIRPQTIRLQDITASPGDEVWIRATNSLIRINGQIDLPGDVANSPAWRASLEIFADDLFFEKCLTEALPACLRVVYDRLMPTGRFDLDFGNLTITAAENGGRNVEFEGDVTLENCLFKISGAQTEAFDTVLKTKGIYLADQGFDNCTMAVDANSVKIQGKAFTNLKADLRYDNRQHRWSTNNIIAGCYGGKLTGKFEFDQPTDAANGGLAYLLQVVFDNVDLRQFLRDTKLADSTESPTLEETPPKRLRPSREGGSSGDGAQNQTRLGELGVSKAAPEARDPSRSATAGKMAGSLNLAARVGDSSSRIGTCRLAIANMRVGRLSPLVKLLQVLKLSLPTEYAFDQMYLDSYIKHNDLLVKKLDLAGESLSFYGAGAMNLETRNVNLTLTGRGKRLATADPSLFEFLTEGIGKAMVRIDVSGSFYDPKVETKPLPAITDRFGLFGKANGSQLPSKPTNGG